MCKISVVVPVYNTKDYLKRCLDSLVGQTINDIEIICINDGSNDGSLDVLKEYEKSDKRVKIIDLKENKGVSYSRNKGIDMAKGRYIAFCDSDDYVEADFFEKLYNNALEKNADISLGNLIEKNGKQEIKHHIIEKIKKYNSKLYFACGFFCSIYKKELISNIKFDENLSYAEDIYFLHHAVMKANKVVTCDDTYYHYIRRQDSADCERLSFEKIKQALYVRDMMINNLIESNCADRVGKKYIFSKFVNEAISQVFRNDSDENIDYCIDMARKFYKKTKELVDYEKERSEIHPLFLKYLKDDDVDSLKDFLAKNNSMAKVNFAYLRKSMK